MENTPKNDLLTLKDLFPCRMKVRKCEKTNLDGSKRTLICANCRVRWKAEKEAIKWRKFCQAKPINNADWDKFFGITEEDLKDG